VVFTGKDGCVFRVRAALITNSGKNFIMTTLSTPSTPFFTYRTALGLVTGIIPMLVFVFFFNKPGDFTPYISILLAMIVSNLFKPMHAAGLAAIIGLITGTVWSLKQILLNAGSVDLIGLFGMLLALGFAIIYYAVLFAFMGFLFGTLVKLYRRGAIF
jgi:hypothetical protein